MFGDLERAGKEISPEIMEKVSRKESYGRRYADHYKEEFVKTTNKKISDFLRTQNLVRD